MGEATTYEKLDIGKLLVTELHSHCMHAGDPAQCNDGCWERGQELAAQIERDTALRIDQAITRVRTELESNLMPDPLSTSKTSAVAWAEWKADAQVRERLEQRKAATLALLRTAENVIDQAREALSGDAEL